MTNIIRMAKIQIINQFRPDKSSAKSSNPRIALYVILAVVYVMIMAFVCIGVYNVALMLKGTHFIADLVLIVYLGGAMLVLFFGIPAIISSIYMGKDTEFLSGLPVSDGTIFLSKLSVVYIYEFVSTLAIIGPPLFFIGIASAQGPIFYLIILLSTFLVPALPIMVASILAIPLMFLVSFFKNKGAFTTIAAMLLYAILFGGYMYLTSQIGNIVENSDPQDIQNFLNNIDSALNILRTTFLPLYSLACVATTIDNWGFGAFLSGLFNIGISVVSLAVLFLIAYGISNLVFKRSAMSQNETSKNFNIKGEFAHTPVLKSLMMRDFKEILRTTSFGFQYLFGIIMAPLMVAFLTVFPRFAGAGAGSMDQETEIIMEIFNIMMPFWIVLMLGSGMNMAASTAISREGKKLYLSKILPVPSQTLIKAKLVLSLIITYISVIISLIIMFIFGLWGMEAIFIPIITLLHTAGFAMFAIRFDLEKPKLNWTNPIDAIKYNRSALVPAYINMGITSAALIGGIVIYSIGAFSFPKIFVFMKLGYWLLLTTLAVIEVIVTRDFLYKDAVRFYERLEV